MTELLPCPFCESEDIETARFNAEWSNVHGHWNIGCPDCGVWYDYLFDTEAKAIEAWNTRAERTCKPMADELQTPSSVHNWYLTCGHEVYTEERKFPPNYCPNCGAKVVKA